VHVRDKIIPLHRSRIAYCYTSNEKVTAYGFDGAAYPLDKTLEALQGLLPESESVQLGQRTADVRSVERLEQVVDAVDLESFECILVVGRFLVHVRDKIIPLHRSRIAYCYTSNEKVTAYGFDGGRCC